MAHSELPLAEFVPPEGIQSAGPSRGAALLGSPPAWFSPFAAGEHGGCASAAAGGVGAQNRLCDRAEGVESFRAAMAQRLVRVLQVCAGHVPGISALNLLSLLRSPENPPSKEL
ncbi:centromere protein M isoform X2 [Rattus norvegicus]|uniref:centromere protein M isoform X2 n=1 Tax=Rattus norvegicus TaxID=10116 RepID=UPI002FD83CBB